MPVTGRKNGAAGLASHAPSAWAMIFSVAESPVAESSFGAAKNAARKSAHAASASSRLMRTTPAVQWPQLRPWPRPW